MKFVIIITLVTIGIIFLQILGRYIIYKIFHFPQVKNITPASAWGIVHRPYRIATHNHKSIETILCAPHNNGPLLIGVHGYENTVEKLVPICSFLTARGYRVLLINTRNHGESDPDGYSTMMQYIQDLQAAIRFSRDLSPANDKVILLGHSLGAAASIYVATHEPAIVAVISIACFADLKQQLRQTLQYHKFPAWTIPAMLRYLEVTHHIHFRDFSPQNSITGITVPLLLLHGSEDQLVPLGDFELLRSSAQQEYVTARMFMGQDHSSLLNEDEIFYCIYDFLKKNDL